MKKAIDVASKVTGLDKLNKKVLREYDCEGCGEEKVKETELTIYVGPRKGEVIVAQLGCKCNDMKLAEEARKQRAKLKLEKMKDRFDYYSLLNESLKFATLDNYEPTNEVLAKAKADMESYVQNFDGKQNMLLHGGYGTGKSHLSVAVTKRLMEQGKQCLFLSLPKLLTKIKDTYNNKGVTEEELLEVVQSVDLLVLDDLGAEHNTEWATAKLFEILDDRAGKATIYTTNLSSSSLRERFNERNFSRLMENAKIVKMTGSDYRRRDF